MSDTLKPCPFCGGAPSLESLVVESVIRCESCGARVVASIHPGIYTSYDAGKRAEDQTVKAMWNTRIGSHTLAEARADALEEAARLIEEGFPRPGIEKKQDTCAHGKFGWEDCESCAAAAIRALKTGGANG